MKTLYILYHLMRAGFLERIRSYNFIIVLGIAVLVGYLFVPADDASYTILRMSGYRGIYNSAWIGVMVAMVSSVFLTLPGFFLVNNSISRDMDTGVGQVIATTPISKYLYIFCTFLSNFSVLALMVSVLVVTSIGMQFMRGESYDLDLWNMLAPFIVITLPSMALISAAAVLFESISWLRRGFGNIVWFFLWLVALLQGAVVGNSDFFGVGRVLGIMTGDAADFLGRENVGVTIASFVKLGETGTFAWEGLSWGSFVLERLFWVLVAVAVVFMASMFFHRFDPSRQKWHRTKPQPDTETEPSIADIQVEQPTVIELGEPIYKFSLVRMIIMEIRMLFNGVRWWWYVVATVFLTTALFIPVTVLPKLLAVSWLWPVLMWSSLGSRETQSGAEQLVFSSPRLLTRQLPAIWLSGFLLAILLGSGVFIRMAIVGNWQVFPGFIIGAAFIPSLALALGIWTGSSKLFEILYVAFFWYVGLMNEVPIFDFASVTKTGQNHTLAYMMVSIILCCLAIVGRHRQLYSN